MVTREMLEERNVELQEELAKYEDACKLVRGALWENQNCLTAMDDMEEEDGNGISHSEVVPQPEGYVRPEPYESCNEAPYDEEDNGTSHDEVVAPVEEEWVLDEHPESEEWVVEVYNGV